ncbi:hypothetical protein DY023_15520 [Microbacterium bovistercoris]|uniref:Uncharacterized protein n=1 Tax=Microbacterium bovistercoris TaxID=2293570 RepID=A0A371NQ55_9MICO|nr:hypothetical protein [Microbacterium bovistercoris]REJ04308.1 hypothetical protein DY023_15520 [Microbacterium bovistercoris]
MTDPFPPQPPAYPAPAQPGYAPPPGAYAVPVGGYQAPVGGYTPPQPPSKGSPALGVAALVLGLIALIVIPILGGVFGAQAGAAAPGFFLDTSGNYDDLAALAPARTQILWTEIAFWSGTAIGIAAIVLGIVAAAKRRGRAAGITGMVLAVLGPVAFALAFAIAAATGAVSTLTAF